MESKSKTESLSESNSFVYKEENEKNTIKVNNDVDLINIIDTHENDEKKISNSIVAGMPEEAIPEMTDEKKERLANWKNKAFAGQVGERRDDYLKTFFQLKNSKFSQKERGVKVDNSSLMSAVKTSLNKLNQVLYRKLDFENTDDTDIYETITSAYDEVIANSKEYLANRRPLTPKGRKRKEYVEKLKKDCEYERSQIRAAIHQVRRLYEDGKAAKDASLEESLADFKYGNILKYCRGVSVEATFERTERGSSGTVFKLKDDDTKLFKKASKLDITPKGVISHLFELVENKKAETGDVESLNVMETFVKNMSYIVDELINNTTQEGKALTEYKADIADALLALFYVERDSRFSVRDFASKIKGFARVLIRKDRLTNAGYNTAKEYYLRLIDIYFEDFKDAEWVELKQPALQMCLDNYNVTAGLFDELVAKHNKIDKKADLSARDVATTRVNEKILGFDKNLYMHCENATASINGKYVDGILLDKVKGKSLGDLIDKVEEMTKDGEITDRYLTPEAAKQLVQIQLADLICAQCDRHEDNIYVQYDEELLKKGILCITGFTGIDNDQAFGNIDSSMIKEGFNRMAFLTTSDGEFAFKKIDRETYDSIMNIQMPDVIFQLADLGISKSELKCMDERIKTIKKMLKEEANSNPEFIVDNYEDLSIRDIYKTDGRTEQGNLFFVTENKFTLFDSVAKLCRNRIKTVSSQI